MRGTALVLAVGLLPAALGAQGFGVYELSTCTMARGGAVAANPCSDGSAIFFNPAGLTALSGTHISAGLTTISPTGGFTDDVFLQHTAMSSQTFLVPNVFITRRLNEKVGVGIGLYAPYGLGTKWPLSFAGRFAGYDTEVKTYYIQPTVAYQVTPRLSLGLGIAYVHASVALHQRLDLSTFSAGGGITLGQLGIPVGTDFANADMSATGSGIAFNGGITFKVNDQLTLGGHFMTKKTVGFSGTANFQQVLTGIVLPPHNPLTAGTPLQNSPLPIDGFLQAQGVFAANGPLPPSTTASTNVVLPDQGSIGFDYKFNDKWHVSGDFQEVVWGWFQQLQVTFANPATPPLVANEYYRDSYGFRFGTEYQYSPRFTLRGGYIYNTAAAPDETVTPRLPEGARNSFIVGAGVNLGSGLHADASVMYLKQNDRRGRITEASTLNTGLYTFKAVLLGAGVSYSF